jgi:thiamine biosynthesis lipoprotein ApbE
MPNDPTEIDQRLEHLESEFAEYRTSNLSRMTRLERLTEELVEIAQLHQRALRMSQQKQGATDAALQALLSHGEIVNRNLDQLTDRVNQLTTAMAQLAQNAEVDRAETRRIWEYLESQQRNLGNGHG